MATRRGCVRGKIPRRSGADVEGGSGADVHAMALVLVVTALWL